MIRVLFNGLQATNRSGTGRYVQELITALLDLDRPLEIALVLPRNLDTPPYRSRKLLGVRRVDSHFRNRFFFEHWGIQACIARYGVDVVHYPASVGTLKRPQTGGVVLTLHDLVFLRHPEFFPLHRRLYYHTVIPTTVQKATYIIADSVQTRNDIVQFLNVSEDRIRTIPLGVSSRFTPPTREAVEQVRAAWSLPSHFFLYVGTIEPRKNLPRLIQAFDKIADDIPQYLVIAGRVGWQRRAFYRALDLVKHRERIVLPGHVTEAHLPTLIGAADAFVWPSLYEGFGLPPLEAMACGTPVLSSNAPAMPEVLGDAAAFVSPYDVDAIAEALRHLAQEESYREQLRNAGLARAQHFSWRRTAEMTCDVYQEAAGSP